jgi:hypothetical protein
MTKLGRAVMTALHLRHRPKGLANWYFYHHM